MRINGNPVYVFGQFGDLWRVNALKHADIAEKWARSKRFEPALSTSATIRFDDHSDDPL
jgi:hypothetical protein